VRTRPDGSRTFYVYGLGLLYEVEASAAGTETGARRNYHFDYRGSTVAISDQAGAVLERIEYSVYGQVTRRSGTLVDTPFLFNGRFGVQTDANGLVYMRARYYSSHLRRFLNSDPTGMAGGLNWYAYAGGNPVSMADPFGLNAMELSGYSWLRNNVVSGASLFADAASTAWQAGLNRLYTGEYAPSPEVYQGATDAAGSWIHDYSPVRGGFVVAGTGNKFAAGTYMPAWIAGVEGNWTIENGFGVEGEVGFGLQMRGHTGPIVGGGAPGGYTSQQFGLSGSFGWNQTEGITKNFGIYGGGANPYGGGGMVIHSTEEVKFGFFSRGAPVGAGLIIDLNRMGNLFNFNLPDAEE
jgi:RHS repeat-associated protein